MVSVHTIKMSSIYRVITKGFIVCVFKKFLIIVDMKMFAIVGENAAPIAVPLIC